MNFYKNILNDFGEAIAAFVAILETKEKAQRKNLIPQI